tara:strand:- start:1473 stop:1694 length:222 start_codon:yes stop_codon:yes gene_type:complete
MPTDFCLHSEYEEPEVAYAAKQILQALSFLAEFDIVHRDLKSDNIMMSVDGDIKISKSNFLMNPKLGLLPMRI